MDSAIFRRWRTQRISESFRQTIKVNHTSRLSTGSSYFLRLIRISAASCSDSPVPTEVQCPICRAPAVWYSLKCAESHLRRCATARAVIAQSVRLAILKTWDYGQLHVRCCNCNNENLGVNWCRCGICYELKWCSFECMQSDPTELIATCFRHAGLSLERSILTKGPMTNDSAVAK